LISSHPLKGVGFLAFFGKYDLFGPRQEVQLREGVRGERQPSISGSDKLLHFVMASIFQ